MVLVKFVLVVETRSKDCKDGESLLVFILRKQNGLNEIIRHFWVFALRPQDHSNVLRWKTLGFQPDIGLTENLSYKCLPDRRQNGISG